MKSYVRCLAAMGIVGGLALSAMAARTVSENLTLTRDTDWSADVVTVANGVTIDLNGHVLKVAGLDGATAASGVVTSSNGGELRFVIPAGTTNTLSKTRLAGNLRVFKEGPGGLVFSLNGQTYSGGTEIVEGTLAPSTAGSSNAQFGPTMSEIRIDAGGVFDFKGFTNFVNYKFNLHGGRLHNSGSAIANSKAMLREVNLYADSAVSGNQFGILSSSYELTYLNLNNFTLTVDMATQSTIFHICHGMIGEGTIHLVRGRLNFYGGNSKYQNYAEKTDIVGEVGTDIYVNNNGYLHARSITTKGRMSGGNWFYVERYVHDVPEGLLCTNSAPLGVSSPKQLIVSFTKKGKGTLFLGNSNNNYSNGFFAVEGCVKMIQGKGLGANKVNPVTISAGATIDINGITSGNVAGSVLFAGDGHDGNGAIQNTGAGLDYYYTSPLAAVGVTLTGHASIGGTGDFALVNPSYGTNTLNLGSYTLTKKGNNHFYLAATTVTGSGTFVVAQGGLGAMQTCAVNVPLVVKSGAALDLTIPSPRGYVGYLTLKNCTMEPGSTIIGSGAGATLNLAGTFTGASSFPCSNLVLKTGATLVLPAGASQFTCAGRFSVADTSAVLDVSPLFANGEPTGDEVTILTAGGVGGIPTIRGAADGWTPVNTGSALKLVKGAAPSPTTLPSLTTECACVSSTTVFDIPASVGATLEPGVYTLASWNVCAAGYGAPTLKIEGCPYETELICGNYDVKLHVKSAAESAAKPVRIWTVGDERVEGNGGSWRIPLAQKLSLEGWNVQMTGTRTAYPQEPSGATTRDAWKRHTGIPSLSIKTTPSQSGLLEGLETHCAAAQEPDFTILQLGTYEYWTTNHYYNATEAAAHWREACDRILAALPDTVLIVTTVMVDTYTGLGWNDANYSVQKATRTALNAAIREQVALDEANGGFPAGRVVLVDLDQLISPTAVDWSTNWRQTHAGNVRVADALRDKLLTLGTAAGKNGAPKVYKVRNSLALDGKFLAVTFNKPVAAPPASATLAAAGGTPVALSGGTLSDDGRTVTYALADELTAQTSYTLEIGAVADADGATSAGETFAFTPRVCGALNNVPAAYTDGFVKLAALELGQNPYFQQNTGFVPYAWRTDLPKSGVTKAGYYIELVRKDTGEMQAMWIDMDSPGASFDSFSLPVTLAQRKQQKVTKLHVWSDYGGIRQVAASDDTVTGFIEFNPINYSGTAKNATGSSREYWSGVFDWNDTLNTSGASGHGCFQIFRQFANNEDGVLPAEALFVFNRWGSSHTDNSAIGFGTFADRKVFGSNNQFDRTYLYGTGDAANFNTAAYSLMRIEFWAKYTPAASRADYTDGAWTGAADTCFTNVANWSASSLAGAQLYLPANAQAVTFTYPAADPVALNPTLYVDGSYAFAGVGAFNLATLDFGATGRITFDPAKTSFRLLTAPKFAAGAKIALDSRYAAYTKGRFLLFTWDNGALEPGTDLASLFDASSAAGASPSLYEEKLEGGGGRLWLDLDVTAFYTPFRVLPVGDSITQGNQSSYGNWRIPLMKKLCAAGFDPTATGLWKIQSFDEAGAAMPEKWSWHSGVSGRRLITGSGGGVLDAIETELDQAGDVDVLLLKIGTNDINSDGTTAEELYAAWLELIGKILAQSSCKIVCGAVVNIADEAKNAQVTAFNARIKAAIEDGTTFPAGRVYFVDLYSACPRYDGGGNYVEGNFYDATNVHPDWPGEDAIAEEYCRVIEDALAGGLPAHAAPETTSGCMNNVPAAYREGFSLAGVIDATRTESLLNDPYVERGRGPTNNILRVGYYIELKRKDTEITCYYDRVRWLWVDMAAFGDRTLDTVGLPVGGASWQPVNALHVIGNMPGISAVAADDDSVRGWVEFSPFNYSSGTSGLVGAPPHTYGYDWNDICSYSGSHSSMQVHRFLEGARHPAQVLFAFNHWATAGACELGLGNYACHTKASLDWTFTSRRDQADLTTLDSLAYEVARIEVWTADAASLAGDAPAPAGVDSLTWRPQVWTDTTAGRVWRNAADATSTTDYFFMPGFDMAFDGVAAYKSVNVPTLMVADAVTISGDGNYVFGGAGSIDANTLTVNLSGNTMATLNGGGISAPDIVIAGGTLKLTTNLVAGALGPGPDGRITVANGGRLAFEYLYTNTANAAYSSLVYDKDIHIAGHGPDGEGAIYHANSLSNNIWFSTLGRVTLDADASIGGNARIDFRAGWSGRTYKGRTQIYGPETTLTVKVRLANRSAMMGLDLNNTDVEVGKIIVDEGASLGAEGTGNWNIPGGVDLLDGARFDCYNTTILGTGTIRIKSGCTAEIRGLNSNSFLFVPVIVEEGATLLLSGSSTVCFEGGLDNRGAILQTANIYFRGDGTTDGLEITNLTFAAGNAYFGQATQGGFPQFGKFELVGGSAGTIYLRTSEDTEIDGSKFVVKAPNATVVFLSRTPATATIDEIPRITIKNAANWEVGRLQCSDDTYCGSAVFDGGTVTAANLVTDTGSNHKSGRFELANGATVSLTNSGTAATLASTTSRSESRDNLLIVGPGCTLTAPRGNFINGYSGRYAHFEMNEGSTVNLKGAWGRRRYNGIPTPHKHDSIFRMNGGTLNIGANGFLAGYSAYASKSDGNEALNTHFNESGPVFRLNNGTLGAFESTVDSKSYRAPGVNIVFGERGDLAGKVSITPNGYTLNLRTGLKGYSDVTVKGSGTLQSSRYMMGIPRGRWKVEAGVDAQLYGAAGFAGGLELADGATASVCAASTNLVEAYAGSQSLAGLLATNFFPHFATDLYYVHRYSHSEGPNYHAYAYRGEFLVTEEMAGTWYFYGKFDDNMKMVVDGVSLTNGKVVQGHIDLAAGWHSFIVGVDDGYGGQGNTWGTAMGLGFRVGSDGGTTIGNYTRFDTTTLAMRPSRTVEWWRKKYAANWSISGSYSTYLDFPLQDFDTMVTTNSIKMCNVTDAKAMTNLLQRTHHRLVGSFYVPEEQAGWWQIKCGFDDFSAVLFDDELVGGVPTYTYGSDSWWYAEKGWHAFEMHFGDTSGGFGVNSQSGISKKAMVAVAVNGGSFVAFDEDHFQIGVTPFVGLADTTTLGAGATLANVGEAPYPVTGTLWGSGTLSGKFAFRGGRLGVKLDGQSYETVAFANADEATFADLDGVDCSVSRLPTKSRYLLGDAMGLTDTAARALDVSFTVGDGVDEERAARCTADIHCEVQGGKLYLVNPAGGGFHMIIR